MSWWTIGIYAVAGFWALHGLMSLMVSQHARILKRLMDVELAEREAQRLLQEQQEEENRKADQRRQRTAA